MNIEKRTHGSAPQGALSLLSIGAWTFALAIGLSGCNEADSDPSTYADPLEDRVVISELSFELDVDMGPQRISFQAGDEQLALLVEENTELLADGATVWRDGEQLTPREAGLELPLRGVVEGEEGSWARVRIHHGSVEGLVFRGGALWELRPVTAGELRSGATYFGRADLEDYLDDPSYENRSCAAQVHPDSLAQLDAPSEPLSPQSAGCETIDVALISDYTHVSALGGVAQSQAEMLARVNESDGIYRADLGYGFVIEEVSSFSSPGGPSFNVASAGIAPLQPFTSWKQSNLPQRGLAHLFVARTTSGTVGIAWVGATCRPWGSAVSNYLGPGRSSTVVVAHEFGHNFGANHDSSNSPFIMRPSVFASASAFSSASKAAIASHVGSSSCFVPCSGSQPQPEPQGPSCAGFCGTGPVPGSSPDCFCDSLCQGYGDCCGDFVQQCL